jgi:hypothetical protein
MRTRVLWLVQAASVLGIPLGWQVLRDGVKHSWYLRRESAIDAAAVIARSESKRGINGELLIKNKSDGRFSQDKRTYGEDPEGSG